MKENLEEEEIQDENIINQQKIEKGESVNLKGMQNFISNLDKKICRILLPKTYESGFLCKIPYPKEDDLLKVLITNNHVLDQETLEKSEKIYLEINNEQKKLDLTVERKIWTDKHFDYTIIEILRTDIFNNYLILDYIVNDENYNTKKLLNSSIILAASMENKQIFFNKRNIVSIPKNNGKFLHNCNTVEGSSGGPIVLVDNFRVIGIHKGYDKKNNKNVGILFRNFIADIRSNII